jgi:hypothetical protein
VDKAMPIALLASGLVDMSGKTPTNKIRRHISNASLFEKEKKKKKGQHV